MDKVQIYLCVYLAFALIAGLVLHGTPKTGSQDFRSTFFGMVLFAPIAGRVFGWW